MSTGLFTTLESYPSHTSALLCCGDGHGDAGRGICDNPFFGTVCSCPYYNSLLEYDHIAWAQ